MVFDERVIGTSEFATALSRLKQQGSALLVVGNVTQEIHQLACRQLMGDPSMHRQRLFVVTDESSTDVQTALADGTHHRDHVIDYVTNYRSATESGSSTHCSATETGLTSATETGIETATASYSSVSSLPDLVAGIVGTIQDIARDAEPLTQGELRVCIDSLSPLVEPNHREVLLRLVWYTAIVTRRRQGMVHIHLPVARRTELASLFEPLIDAVVELRVTDGVPQQRWHLIDATVTSDWTGLDE